MTYRIEAIDRLNGSVNGNPRFRFAFTDLSEDRPIFLATSQSDAAFCYSVGNPGMRVGCEVEVQFTRAGRVSYMTPVVRDYSKPEPLGGHISDEAWSD